MGDKAFYAIFGSGFLAAGAAITAIAMTVIPPEKPMNLETRLDTGDRVVRRFVSQEYPTFVDGKICFDGKVNQYLDKTSIPFIDNTSVFPTRDKCFQVEQGKYLTGQKN